MHGFYTPTPNLATVDAYADVPLLYGASQGEAAVVVRVEGDLLSGNIKNTGANSITYQLLGSNKPDAPDADWKVVSTGALAAGAVAHIETIAYYSSYKLQSKATAGGSQGATQAHLLVKSKSRP